MKSDDMKIRKEDIPVMMEGDLFYAPSGGTAIADRDHVISSRGSK